MKRTNGGFFIILFCLSLVLSLSDVSLAANYYEGKVLKIVVGSTPGGGYDHMARLFAKYLNKYIPGKPTIIVENMPGAAHVIAANYLYNLAKRDGLTIGIIQPGIVFSQLFKTAGVKYDAREFGWIGSAAISSRVFCVRSELPYQSIDELRKVKNPVYVGGAGPGSTDHQYSSLLKEILGLNLKMIVYPATAEIMLAIARKEVDAKSGSYSSMGPFIERGVLRPLIRGRISEPGIENLPVDEELATDKIGKAIFAMRSAGDPIDRPFMVAPGTPANLLNILRDAFTKAAKDPLLKRDAERSMTKIETVSGQDCSKTVNYLFSQPDDIVKQFIKYTSF